MHAVSTTLLLAGQTGGEAVNAYDIVFPVIAFLLVIILPMATGVWVLIRALKDNAKEADET